MGYDTYIETNITLRRPLTPAEITEINDNDAYYPWTVRATSIDGPEDGTRVRDYDETLIALVKHLDETAHTANGFADCEGEESDDFCRFVIKRNSVFYRPGYRAYRKGELLYDPAKSEE